MRWRLRIWLHGGTHMYPWQQFGNGFRQRSHVASGCCDACTSSYVDHDIIGPLYYERHFTNTPIQFADGCAIVPEGLGWGMDVEWNASR